MVMAQLTSSPFFGGPERQMLGLALAMPADYKTVFLLFRDKGKSQAFRSRLEENGLETHLLEHHTPHVPAMVSEIAHRLRGESADLLCCHGYKADVVGLLAARRVGIPVISVSRGWTGETWKVRQRPVINPNGCCALNDIAVLRRPRASDAGAGSRHAGRLPDGLLAVP